MQSRTISGLNMLRVADNRPDLLQYCLENVVELYQEGKIKPIANLPFKSTEIAEAHEYVQSRKSVGKVAIAWVE
jgi:NADPH2:quinone reductase